MGWTPFNKVEEKKILDRLEAIHSETTGILKFHIDKYCKGSISLKAENLFKHLNMLENPLKNGILIYVAAEDRKIAILADELVSEKIQQEYLDEVKNEMIAEFQEVSLHKGVMVGLDRLGEGLKLHFPVTANGLTQ